MSSRVIRLLSLAFLLVAGPLAMLSQTAAPAPSTTTSSGKPTLKKSDYGKFEAITGSALSPDGKWIAYVITRGERGTGGGRGRGADLTAAELRYRPVESGEEKTIARASAPAFTSNSRWLVYTLASETAGGNAARGGARGGTRGGERGAAAGAANTPSTSSVGVVDLGSGAAMIMHELQSYALSSNGHHVALRRAPAQTLGQGTPSRGADLVIRDLATGMDVTFGNVAEYAWSDDGSMLAMVIDVAGKTGNGIQVFNTATSTIRTLDSSDLTYSNPRWRKKGDDVVVYRSRQDDAFVDTSYTVLSWKGVSSPSPTKHVYDFTTDAGFPKDMRVASDMQPQWSEDGTTLFFGIARREPKPTPPTEPGNAPAAVKIQIWHSKDVREWPQQRASATQDLTRTHVVAWRVDENRITRLADDELPNVTLSNNYKVAIAPNENPYFMEIVSGRQYRDVYTIDVVTGKRTKVLTKAQVLPTMSPSGRYLIYTSADQKSGDWFVMDVTTGTKTNLTAGIQSVFVNLEDDHPTSYRRGYGVGGWLTGETSLILYDRFDLWQVNVDGKNPVRLTRGKEDDTVYRIDRAGSEEPTIDPSKSILLTATGEYNKRSGFSSVKIGQPAQRLMWAEKGVGGLIKSKDADVYAFTAQTAADSPQLYVTTGSFADAKPVSRTNEFLKEYAWGKQVLMDYTNKRGDKLKMMLTYPADYQPGKKYPMVLYYYEKLSQGFHNFVVPSSSAMYNTTVFSQAGYFVLRPDILFQARNAGPSGLDCVLSATKTALSAVPDIDPKRVGVMGHSWGGYQSAYYAVHGGDTFAAAIAGAPLTNFISMYGYSSGNTGSPETGHFETGQERMEVSLWEDPEAYIRNSTVFQTNQLKIPLLLEEGEADGNVNYFQSMELYNFGRRLGKNVVFLVYEGENHGLTGDAAVDYHQRQLEWFGHWLKGEPAAEWIVKGEPYLTRKKILDTANPPAEGGAATPANGQRGGARGGRGGPM
jgi:dipeptidyl aminopeptidase/acylaminoacyl peptidase